MLRMILGEEIPDTGEIKIGPSISIGHYAQEHETLDFNQTVLDAVRYAGEMSESRATAFLLRYLFTINKSRRRLANYPWRTKSLAIGFSSFIWRKLLAIG